MGDDVGRRSLPSEDSPTDISPLPTGRRGTPPEVGSPPQTPMRASALTPSEAEFTEAPRAARFASSANETDDAPSGSWAHVPSRRAAPDTPRGGPARAAFQPALTGLPTPPATPAHGSQDSSDVEPPTEELPAVQDGPALFAWEHLTPRSSASTTMSQVTDPLPTTAASVTGIDDVPMLEDARPEVPWTPDPDLGRSAETPDARSSAGPEHGTPPPPEDEEAADERRRWYALGALAVVLALAVFVAYMALGGRYDSAEPTTGTSEQGSAEPSATAPAPSGGTAPESPQPSPSTSASPQPSPTPSPTVLDLGDTSVTVLPGWQVYADEVVQDDRRLVRIKHATTDTRIQIVTLTSITGDLQTACTDLTTEHRQAYSDVADSATVDVSVAAGATGVACGFTGTRISDKVEVKVDFTIVQRASDKTSIVFRDVVTQTVPADSPARTELATMECGAADDFGVTISQCASATPGQGDG